MMVNGMATVRDTDTPDYETNDDRWQAIAERDREADGHFVYGVRTTGVYCRPSCPSRLARRDHVAFFASAAEARAAGLRPCKRCHPDANHTDAAHADAIARACRLIEQSDETPSLERLADEAGLSRFHFHRLFKAHTGLTPHAYASAHRAGRARRAVVETSRITDAVYESGFGSSGRFYAASTMALGMRPAAYRAGGQGATIRFAVGECSLGSVLVAATTRGVCAILFGDDPARLVRDLEDQFRGADLIGDDPAFARVVAQVVGFVEKPGTGLALPLHVRGTAFQHRVWHALRELAPGETTSYGEIARRIGAPRSVRAVAQACASNPVAVAIPCHRVVRRDGSSAGYRWGVERKDALLDRERTAVRPGPARS
jgi:AraC family transcriptional regulator of adaptative response/methylated-DNA-[protein]-cysteine methyltransferase